MGTLDYSLSSQLIDSGVKSLNHAFRNNEWDQVTDHEILCSSLLL